MTTDPIGTNGARAPGAGVFDGDRVRLRGLRDDDLATLAGWMADPDTKGLTEYVLLPNSTAADRERLLGLLDNRSAPATAGLVVETLPGGSLVGFIASSCVRHHRRSGRLSLLIGPEHRGEGLGSDAVRVFQRIAFQELGLHRLELEVFDFNAAALRTYRRTGFVEEGRLREVVLRHGRRHDVVLMSILDSEWRAAADAQL